MKKAYISNIEVYGFKSYGDRRLSIPLSENFTAIVGPNGAGKSNIGDSIAFCLGIASTKAMRASKLTDLIFSSKGKSAPFAEVEITFQNFGAFPLNSQEVRIYRRIDLSGKSVFKINSRPVKQKEIQDLLVEANIYPQGYNIITQGDIYKFVHMTPYERKNLISEIAGISQYEEKKEKALVELAQTQEKIAQVRLVLKEVQQTLKKLEEERENALLAKQIEDRIEEVKRNISGVRLYHFLKELENTSNQLTQIENQIESFQKRKEEIIEIQKQLYLKIKEHEEKLGEINQLFLPYKQQEGSITAQISQKNSQVDTLEKELNQLQNNLRDLQREKEEKLREIESLKLEIDSLKSRLPQLEKQIQTTKHSIDEKSHKIKEFEEKQGKSKESLLTLEEEERKLKELISQKERDKTELSIQLASINQKIESAKQEIDRYQTELDQLSKQLTELTSNTENFELKLNSINSEISRYKVRKEVQEKKLKEIRQKLEENFKSLASILAQLSQFKDDKISLMLKDIPGVYGQVSDLISLKDQSLQTAIEAAAGSRLKNIVVEDEDTAKRCIELLKREKLGRTVFIPLTTIRYSEPPKLHPKKGILGYAIDFVVYDKKVEKAIKYVFSDTVIVETFDDAKAAGIGNYRMVTLDGEIFEKSGTISGGTDKQTSAIGKAYLENKRAVLEKEDERLKKEEQQIEEEIKSLNQKILQLENSVRDILAQASTYEYKVNDLKNQINQRNTRIDSLTNQISQLKLERNTLEQKLEDLEKEIHLLTHNYQDITTKKAQLLKNIEDSGFLKLRQEWEKETAQYYSLQQQYNQLQSQIDSLNTKLHEVLIKRVNELNTLIAQTEEKIQLKQLEKEELKEQIKRLTEELSNLWKELADKEKERNQLSDQIEQFKEEIRKLRYEEDQINRQITYTLEDRGKLSQKLADIQQEIELLKAEYDGPPVEADIKELEKQLKDLEKRRKDIGQVNQKAVEDYEEMFQRFREIEEKLEVLLKEKKSIDELIETLEEKKLAAFMEIYNHIDKNLSKNFKILSPGGKAYLEIENISDPLSGGVFIKVQPRGKDITRLELMSGGEKTLAALAFLFAVLSIKPAPFYYLDEVDAALDDTNVRKVGQLIKELSKQTQFIVVTHKEAMASYADILIGVSAKDGISSVYTLDMNDLKQKSVKEESLI